MTSAKKALRRNLGSSGFLDITAPFQESFATCLQYRPAEREAMDLDPGVLKELLSLVKSTFAADPRQALEVQARVRPERAIRLLK